MVNPTLFIMRWAERQTRMDSPGSIPSMTGTTMLDTVFVAENLVNQRENDMNSSWVVEVQEDPQTGDAVLEFPPDLMAQTGWREGDTLSWKDNLDGSFTLAKKETEWVMVDCVSTFRQRYLVEVPAGKAEWALDTVTMEKAREFSQVHLGEQIVSHRVVTLDEALAQCDVDNDYARDWSTEAKIRNMFTSIDDQDIEQ